ncbi:Mitochondrial DNA replication protein yhm2, partial [Coemansia sp. RSA 2599]
MSKAIETGVSAPAVSPTATAAPATISPNQVIEKKALSWSNVALGAAIQTFEVSTLGQPFEVVKTHMAANRGDSIATSLKKTYARGGISGFYQGLIP